MSVLDVLKAFEKDVIARVASILSIPEVQSLTLMVHRRTQGELHQRLTDDEMLYLATYLRLLSEHLTDETVRFEPCPNATPEDDEPVTL